MEQEDQDKGNTMEQEEGTKYTMEQEDQDKVNTRWNKKIKIRY